MHLKPTLLASIATMLFSVVSGAQAQWVRVSNGLPQQGMTVYSLAAIDTTLMAGTDQGCYRSNDLGESWTLCSNFPANSGISPTATIGVFAAGPKFYASSFRHLVVSSDLGTSWALDTAGLRNKYDAIGSIVGWGSMRFLAGNTGIFRSMGDGLPWEMINNGLPNGTMASGLAFVWSDVFACTNSGVFRSTDSGTSWNATSQGKPTYVITALDTILVGGVGGPNGWLITSSDRGATWTQLYGTHYGNVLIANDPYIFDGSTDSGVYVAKDGAQHWSPAHRGLSRALISALTTSSGYLFAGTNQGSGTYPSDEGVWRMKISDIANAGVANSSSATIELSPNPTTGLITIEGAPSRAHVTVLNLLGQSVLESSEQATAFTLDLSPLAPGVYCVRIYSPLENVTRMIVRE
ncbi:MAG: T9SS type A sorting domain-containing protein [Bacteroidota bacterium]|nr:T9SS type A sorting domain-containing protein [Bacteroidota bacterium]MDP4232289.1 T9SS type A sorting domain-containing protein [Bacteroidota bacterium]MDP4241428.1 T9SS type A sorting domain-containing protein [Bacteroidota bacterium]MDP4286748.1 T9SS type A sorting domain-containing protein [Bacteroidota bacterium]